MFLCHMLADRLAERDVAKHYTVFFWRRREAKCIWVSWW